MQGPQTNERSELGEDRSEPQESRQRGLSGYRCLDQIVILFEIELLGEVFNYNSNNSSAPAQLKRNKSPTNSRGDAFTTGTHQFTAAATIISERVSVVGFSKPTITAGNRLMTTIASTTTVSVVAT